MSHLISVELDSDVAKNILNQLDKQAMPPLDADDEARNKLRNAIFWALIEDVEYEDRPASRSQICSDLNCTNGDHPEHK